MRVLSIWGVCIGGGKEGLGPACRQAGASKASEVLKAIEAFYF